MIRTIRDVPNLPVGVNFEMLSQSVSDSEHFAKLFGITSIPDYSLASALHPLRATDVGKKLGAKSWHVTNKLLDRIKEQKGIDLKSFDNKYHRAEQYGKNPIHWYSHEMVNLLQKVQNDESYTVDV